MTAPRLDRTSWPAPARPVRIVHIGIGNFSRAHQAWYTMAADADREWGISAFTGRRPDAAEALGPQQGLYTLIERGNERDKLSVIEVVSDVLPGSDLDGFTAAIGAAQTALVTLTVTEAGYRPGAGPPQRLAAGLVERHRRHAGALAIVSCDNLHLNGQVLRERVIAEAEPIDAEAAGWIDREVSFVSTSVDRITPRITDEDRALVVEELGLEDGAPVVTEPFCDWILSGEFPAGRPEWELAGARFVSDIEPWELRKLWMLNGAHSLLAFLGLSRGHTTVADAIGDGELVQAMERFWDLAGPLLPHAGELELDTYRRETHARFANARMGYPLTQIAGDGLDKLRQRVVPVIQAAQQAGVSPAPAVRVVHAWAQWLIEDPERAGSDQSAEQLRRALGTGGGADTMRELFELVGLPELEIE
jgi:fructuronate reductase